MRGIFRKRNPDVEALFESAGLARKVMCVAFDYAKKVHTAVVCDGSGRQLRGVFNVENNRTALGGLVPRLKQPGGSIVRCHPIRSDSLKNTNG